MRFIYGKQDWITFERGEENCYLMTNGLGGFSSLSMIGSCSRNDQAVLMACMHAPNHRYQMVHRLEEKLWIGDTCANLSSQDVQCHENRQKGYLWQTKFVYEDYPQWTYLVDGVEIVRTIAMKQGENTVGISWRIRNHSKKRARLSVRPHLQFVKKGERLLPGQEFLLDGEKIVSNGLTLYYRTNGNSRQLPLQFFEDLYYADDVRDGKMVLGCTAVNQEINFEVEAGKEDVLELVYSTSSELPLVEQLEEELRAYRRQLISQSGFLDPVAQALSAAADQFISERESTGRKTILAGFPFFEDWGRDTMIALMGCCISTRQYHTAVSILRTFMPYCRKGLIPNLFPEGTQEPWYNTADASLLFILAVYEYVQKTKDEDFAREAYPLMRHMISWYKKGTDFGICMDTDGLIRAGQRYDQVTWMDVRVGDILPTPRHGKPVELNAYWYNALRVMEAFRMYGGDAEDYGTLACQVQKSFTEKFWDEELGCLKDVVSATPADRQVRCNQIWAVSLPFSLLPPEKEKQVVETVYRELYTPYGLRTLSCTDPQFHGYYGGDRLDRDLAYHQGTVWTFPLGGYYLAYLKVNGYSDEAKQCVREQLENMQSALREGCVGQLPEIYDGKNPTVSKGCFAQAWSVGEILRVYDALR